MPDTNELYCPKDFNLGDFRDDHCNVGGIPCPEPLEADPEKVVQVSCGPCGRFWGIPIDKIMKNKASHFHSCSLSECAAKIIVPVNSAMAQELAAAKAAVASSVEAERVTAEALAQAAPAVPAGASLVDDRDLAALRNRDVILSKLEAAGVDNWEGYPALGEDDEDGEEAPAPVPTKRKK